MSKNKKNQIKDLGCGLISKQFVSKDNLDAEVVGSAIFNYLSPGSAAEIVLVGGGNCVIKRVAMTETLTRQDKRFLEFQTAAVVAKVCKAYPLLKNLVSVKTWKETLENIISGMENNKQQIADVFGGRPVDKMQWKLEETAATPEAGGNLTFIHGDLHFGNLALDSGDMTVKILDFEHSKEAPLEMEFQNSLLFNDAMSLDVKNMRNLLTRRFGVEYSAKREKILKIVYLCDQCVKATAVGDMDKLELLKNKAKRYVC